MGEEDLKGLEEEIDDAVDRLFVEKKRRDGGKLFDGISSLRTFCEISSVLRTFRWNPL